MIDKLIKNCKKNIEENKKIMEDCKVKINKLTKYELTELLELETRQAFHKGWYMSDTKTLQDLEKLKKVVREELYGHDSSIAEYKGACKRLGVDTDE